MNFFRSESACRLSGTELHSYLNIRITQPFCCSSIFQKDSQNLGVLIMTVDIDIDFIEILGTNNIRVGYRLFDYIAKDVLENIQSSTYVVITDSNITHLYLEDFCNTFAQESLKKAEPPRLLSYIIPPGEISKSRSIKAEIEDWLLSNTCTRDTVIFAMGGGVIGDLIGFVAATFMRGIRFIQIPTTLLAMVDSSIGGKTAIDTDLGKNLIGAFWQPQRTYVDLRVLETLPEREFINGMAEVIKTAAIWNESDFLKLEKNADRIISAISKKESGKFVQPSIMVKAYVVSADEREGGLRNLLNFGHSIGHAYEAILTPEILHGECVSIGMIAEAQLARSLGVLSTEAVSRLKKCLESYKLPVTLEDKIIKVRSRSRECPVHRLISIMGVDKKNDGAKKKIVLLAGIGRTFEKKASNVADVDIKRILDSNLIIGTCTKSLPEHVTVVPPGSKSISNRTLVLAALGKGSCRIRNLLHSDDTQYMLTALEQLGAATFEWEEGETVLVVNGRGGSMKTPPGPLYLGNAGTAARFLTTICNLVKVGAIPDEKVVITGNDRMKQRPIGPLVDALRENRCSIVYKGSEGSLPLEIVAGRGLQGGTIELQATISSQYVSSILMCAPYAMESVTLSLVGGEPISQTYIDMTIAMMVSFGVHVKTSSTKPFTYLIPRGCYVNPKVYTVESDASSATYPLAMAAIMGTKCTIPNIGSESLQGDARFAVEVLRPMGCKVIQTGHTTQVQGPPRGTLKPLSSVDMEPMTDAFLSASILAAVAQSTTGDTNITNITGIANQRVKESNRITAMIDELEKFGVFASELSDGISIEGCDINNIHAPRNGVFSYDDHRVAMSFSVLASAIPEPVIILDKKCVEKTWPTWWECLRSTFKVPIQAAGEIAVPSFSSPPTKNGDKSIFLIGMRGAGKTTCGIIAAEIFNWKFVDMDQVFESELGNLRDFVNTEGWETFRSKEIEILKRYSKSHAEGYIISCGGGIVEKPETRQLFSDYNKNGGLVVHIHRDIEQIVRYLESDVKRPMYGEDIRKVWSRRKEWYDECSNYQFYTPVGVQLNLNSLRSSLTRFFQFITGKSDVHDRIVRKQKSYFLSLTFPEVFSDIEFEQELDGCDAVELRVDLLSEASHPFKIPSIEYVAEQLAILQTKTFLPIIFTIRTIDQGGKFPLKKHSLAFELIQSALRWGVEYIDVEITWPDSMIHQILEMKGNSKIIASWHSLEHPISPQKFGWEEKFRHAAQFGDIVKLVGTAGSIHENFQLEEFRTNYSKKLSKPIILINMGSLGQLSRIMNSTLTPVTHSGLPVKAAPGQLTIVEINKGLNLLGILPRKTFYLFGRGIGHSKSPILHNTLFSGLGLPHRFELCDLPMAESLQDAIRGDFGGAAVTIPYKLDVIKYMGHLSDEARIIGAVNTIIPIKESGKRVLYGDNTDWIGIKRALLRNTSIILQNAPGVIIGAGGTCRAALFAYRDLGVSPVYIVNRTESNILKIKEDFSMMEIIALTSVEQIRSVKPQSIVSTVPANVDMASNVYEVVDQILSESTGVLLEMAYKPKITPMMHLAETKGWKTIEGLNALVEQGMEQFKLWTGFNPSVKVAYEAVKD
ncbi:Pentafunctional AROM polypeptide [Neolecta irregularis DAH-3]|uniref:Pentafunctional AROM polypeptide n=1 Tax=Neolecta irregularis (strain DAH-3) TaxID=1198029 RepID=A0A1U7LT92_NEOID|nr:Pentafunctional AROM polypeptide [Neolecta irregularis DAH-3]|eukprot:OLL25762.1 Pentafunctional AROM polypeptide [Neolecta irregularis DAH-3]